MNHYQQLARARLTRRFSTGDGIRVLQGAYQGFRGWVVAVGGGYQETGQPPVHDYVVKVRHATGAEPLQHLVTQPCTNLASSPADNQGKYGGPSRGGASEGWRGSSRYRARPRRR